MLSRIVVSPDICHGKARIKGTRVPVHIILDLLTAGETEDSILMAYPQITKGDIRSILSVTKRIEETNT